MRKNTATYVLALGAGLWSLTASATQAYTVTNLQSAFGDWSVTLSGINNRGEIAGMANRAYTIDDPSGSAYGFVYSNGEVRNITASLGYGFSGDINSMNDNGDVVGYVRTPKEYAVVYQPFVAKAGGELTTFSALKPGSQGWDHAYGINNAGQIVGDAEPDDHGTPSPFSSYNHPFLYANGQGQDLGTLGGPYWSSAHAINNLGQITGQASTTQMGVSHAFIYQNGQMQDIGTLSGSTGNSYGWDINDAGAVVGQADAQRGSHAFLYQDGQMINLDTFGSNLSSAGHINAKGEVIGVYVDAENNYIPFYYSRGTGSIKLNDLLALPEGWTMVGAADINDAGQIIGRAKFGDSYIPVLLTPVPEASTGAQLSLGLMLLLGVARQRRNRAA